MIGRLLHSVDFERVLRVRSHIQTTHFALHHVPGQPSIGKRPRLVSSSNKLSTGDAPTSVAAVDDFDSKGASPSEASAPGVWFGTVVPKRHARRSVTRSLLKRQIRATMSSPAVSLQNGLWVVRLRAAFDVSRFRSAASDDLQQAARDELTGLFAAAARSIQRVAPR